MQPSTPRTKLDEEMDLNAAFGQFDNESPKEPVVAVAAPVAEPDPVAQVLADADQAVAKLEVDEPIVIPEPVRQQIETLAEQNYRQTYVAPLQQLQNNLVQEISQYLEFEPGSDVQRDFIEPLTTGKFGVDGEFSDKFNNQYLEELINQMRPDTPNVLKLKIRHKVESFLEAKQRRQEADQANWKEQRRSEIEQSEIKARKNMTMIDRAIAEPEFRDLRKLRGLAQVGDVWAKEELEKLDRIWMPHAEVYAQKGYDPGTSVRMAWRDLLRQHKITFPPWHATEVAPKPRAAVPAKERTPFQGSLNDRLKKSLAESFEKNLSKEQRPATGGFYKG